MGDLLAYLYIAGALITPFGAMYIWVLEARETGQPVTKTDFANGVTICLVVGLIWPIALVLTGLGLAIDWWLDRA